MKKLILFALALAASVNAAEISNLTKLNGVTVTGITGTGKIAFSDSPAFTTTATIGGVTVATQGFVSAGFQPLDADLTTYSGITPSANVQTLLGAATFAAFKSSLSLGNVQDTALSTWAGSTNITTVGTITVGTFSGTLGAISGANLTTLNATNLASGTVPDARFPATFPAASGVNLTALNATQLTSGTVPDARFPATLPAASGANLTALSGTNISTGTVASARGGIGTVSGLVKGDGAGTSSAATVGTDFPVSDSRNRNLTAMSLVKSLTAITGVSNGISGATYNPRSGTVFLVRNVSGAAGTIYEVTTEGALLRTITNSNFIDTEAIEYVTSFRNSSGTLYDVFLVGEEDHTTIANESQITLCLLTPAATTLDRTAINGGDQDNVTTTTAYSGGTGLGNFGLESIAYDPTRGTIYYTAEFGTQVGSDNTVYSSGNRQTKIFTRSIVASTTSLLAGTAMSFGSESTLVDISALSNGGALNNTDISDMSYDAQSDTLLIVSEANITDKVTRLTRAGAVVESMALTTGQCEGIAISPDGDHLFIAGENQEFQRFEMGNRRKINTTTAYAAGTAYSLTASAAALDFGTTDPSVTLPSPGTWFITGTVNLKYNAATFAGNQTATVKFRRTNNTAADLTGGTVTATTRIITSITDLLGIYTVPSVIYTTANSNDAITIFGSLSATPSAGSVDATEASILAIQLE